MKHVVAGCALILVLVGCGTVQRAPVEPSRLNPMALVSPGGTIRASVGIDGTYGDNGAYPSISANGRYVAFTATTSLTPDGTGSFIVTFDIFVHDHETGTTTRVSVDSDGHEAECASESASISDDGRYVAFESCSPFLVANDTNRATDVFVHDRVTGDTTLVSVNSQGGQAHGSDSLSSGGAAISGDGRYVAFHSTSYNLVDDDSTVEDVFVHDRTTGTTTRVSTGFDGSRGNAASNAATISADGRYVAFQSQASNLVEGDTNNASDVFVHDRVTGTTTRVSVDSDGNQSSYAYTPSISGDGRYVAFQSGANDLVAGDTNNRADVFVHDRVTGTTTRVSVDSEGNEATDSSQFPSISADGRYVAFESRASNLVEGDTNNASDVFVHDRVTGTTTLASTDRTGESSNGRSQRPSMSSDGTHVAFHSYANDLTANDTNDRVDVFVHRLAPTNLPPRLYPGDPYTGTRGISIPLDTGYANDPENDPLAISWTVSNPSLCTFTDATVIHPFISCTDAGTFTVTLTADDGLNDPVSASTTLTILLPDADEDGVSDAEDNCASTPNDDQADADGDGVGDACDNAPNHANPGQEDGDGDGVADVIDNCPAIVNPDQTDTDGDGPGDVCDPIDQTAPSISSDVDGTLGTNDWYVSPVTITWTVTDDESDITSTGCEPTTHSIDTDEAGVSFTCEATSEGGTSSESVTFKLDATPPDVQLYGATDGDAFELGFEPTLDCSTTDGASGVQEDATLTVTGGNGNGVGAFTATCDGASDNAGNDADPVSVTYAVVYAFDGFYEPLENLPVRNRMNAGRSVPIKFSLAGDHGLGILDGTPTVRRISCSSSDPTGEVEDTEVPGKSGLSYDATRDEYTYVMRTNRGWRGTCREFTLTLDDGTQHIAHFEFR